MTGHFDPRLVATACLSAVGLACGVCLLVQAVREIRGARVVDGRLVIAVVVGAVWLLASPVVALGIGRAIRIADRHAARDRAAAPTRQETRA